MTGAASAVSWQTPVGTNVVADGVITGGGYPVPPGATRPDPGTCRSGLYNANRSESWIAVKPGTETLIGNSKIFFEKYSTFYDFHLGTVTFQNGAVTGANQVQGYDCVSTGTQDMPPSWTNNTDPNVDFDTQGRAYQVTLPFNAFWEGGLHPNGAIDVSYSDDLGAHWIKGNGGQDLEPNNNQTSLSSGHVEDKQWIAVNHFAGTRFQDHVYAAWTTFNGAAGNGKIRLAVSGDRGLTFRKAITITAPGVTTPATTYVYPSVGADGTLYVAFVGGFDTTNKNRVGHVYVTRSLDDGVTFGPFVEAATPGENPNGFLPNTNFRDGIIESFTASQTYPGHVYLTYEDWDAASGQFDVKFRQSTDGGLTWSPVQTVNDAPNSATTDQFQPSVAAGPGGAVAVAFYDRQLTVPERPVDPAAARGRRKHLHRRLAPGVQGRRNGGRCRAGRRQREGLAVHLGSRPVAAEGRRDHPVRVRRTQRSVPDGPRLHRRLLRARDLERQRLHVRGLDALPLADGDRRRRRARLLPAAGARNRAPIDLRGGLLERSTLWAASVLAAHTSIESPTSSTRSRPSGRWVIRSTVRDPPRPNAVAFRLLRVGRDPGQPLPIPYFFGCGECRKRLSQSQE